MPNQSVPGRRFKTMIERIRDDGTRKQSQQGGSVQKVTTGRVEQVLPGNKVTVNGATLPVTGNASGMATGQRVAVAWSDGKPTAAIFHHAQSAQFVPTGGDQRGIVEQLFIAGGAAPATKPTVWFRNDKMLTELRYDNEAGTRLSTDFSENPKEVFWGVNTDVFGVLEGTDTAPVVHVYRINRKAKDKILTSAPRVKEKLYTINLSTVQIDLVNVTGQWSRNSVETYVELKWSPDGSLGPFVFNGATLKRDPATNNNSADVTRSLTIRLKGLEVSFVNGSPVPASEIVVPSGVPPQSLKAFLHALSLDANDELLYSVRLEFKDWGIWQGNSTTGLTGDYNLLGEGTLTNAGVCFVIACPHLVDHQVTQDFMGHGNPSGVVASHITETHSVVIRARAAEKVFSTLAPDVTLQFKETSDGAAPYRIVTYSGMPVIADQCYAVDTWRGSPGLGFTYPTVDVGGVGDVGLLKSERSLFNAGLSFTPDLPSGNDPTPATPTRAATIRVVVNQEGYDFEWVDTFGNVCGTFTGNSSANAHVKWNSDSVGVFDRYSIDVTVTPFYAVGADPYLFISVLRTAKRPVGYTTDQNQFGVFVLKGSTLVTLVNYTNIADAGDTSAPEFMAGNSKRVLWRRGAAWFMSDFVGNHAQAGDNADDAKVVNLELTNPDFLYAAGDDQRYFAQGWNRATLAITLNQAEKGFPKREAPLARIGVLRKLGDGQKPAEDERSTQTIKDVALLPPAYKNL